MRSVQNRTVVLAVAALGGVLMAGSSEAAAAEKVDRLGIVDAAIRHHGGDAYTKSLTSLTLSSRSGSFGLTVRVDGGSYEYTVVGQTSEGATRRVLAGNDRLEVWLDGKGVPVAADEEQRWRDFAGARVYFCFLPYRLNDDSVYKEDLGPETWAGRELHKVKVTFGLGSSSDASDEYLYWFDAESGRLEQFAYSFKGNPGGLRFRRLFNYRRVGGILFFDQENLGVEAAALSVDRISPDFVEGRMRLVSTVTLTDLEVSPLE